MCLYLHWPTIAYAKAKAVVDVCDHFCIYCKCCHVIALSGVWDGFSDQETTA